ncbi:MAG: phosphotransferase, partial [Alphaproteobacteria bacterium]
AEFIYSMHNSDPTEISDLKSPDGDGWNHNDICNNVIINKKTKDIVGIIDWEYAGWGPIATELNNVAVFSSKFREAKLKDLVTAEYEKLLKKHEKH